MKKVSLYFISTTFLSGLLTAQNVNFVEASGSPINAGTSSLRGFASGDLNGDGKKDFVIGNSYANTLSIFLGNGAGQFSHANGSPLASGSGPIYTVIADFNNDQVPDISTANYEDGNISIKLGTGNGTFINGPMPTISTGGWAYCIDSKDFNLDGNMDLVTVAALTGKVYVFLGDGTGNFLTAPGSPYNVGIEPNHVSTGNFNSDNNPDFVVANGNSSTISVFLGNGSGGFSQAPGSPYEAGYEPRTISVKDINNDSRSDLIVANGTGNDVSLFFGQTDGSFVEAPGSPIATGQYAYQTAIADFNSDGQQDISVTNGLDDEVMFFLGSGTGSFTNADNSPIAVGTNPQPICTDDFDGDGKPDVLVGHFLSQDVIVLLNKNPVGISVPTKSRNLNAFPNPAKDGVRINVQNFQQGMVMIVFDAVGKEVDRVSVSSADFLYPGKNLAKGIYVFGIYFNNIELGSGKIIFE